MQKPRRRHRQQPTLNVEQLEGIRLLSSVNPFHLVPPIIEQAHPAAETASPLSVTRNPASAGLVAANAIASQSASYKGFPSGNCTFFAAREFDKIAPTPGVNWHGNAGTWYANAGQAGWVTKSGSRDAVVGAIIVWRNGGNGHVAIVRQVTSSGITIQEMNWVGFGQISSRTLPFSNLNRASYQFAGYVLPRRK